MHGYAPKNRAMSLPKPIGIAEVTKVDKDGLWMRAIIDDSELSTRTWNSALRGEAKASTGSVNYLARPQDREDGTPVPGEVTVWPIAELSVWDGENDVEPVSDDAIVLPIRALFKQCEIELPESFEVGENKNSKEDKSKRNLNDKGETMTKEIEKAVQEALEAQEAAKVVEKEARDAMRAELLKEIKETPKKYEGIFINKIDDKEAKKDADKEETFSYVRALVEDGRRVADGGRPHIRAAIE